MLFQLAWKNIWRNKTRSLVVAGSVMVGLWVGAFTMAYVFGMIDQRLQDAVENEVSHFQIHHPRFEDDNEARFLVPQGPELLTIIQKDPRVKSAGARVITYGMIGSAQTSTGGKFLGMDPPTEEALTGIKSKLTQGEYFQENSHNKVIISERLAQKLKVKLRSKIVLTFQDTTGNIVAGAFRIIALYKTYNTGYDDTHVFLKSADLWDLLGTQGQYQEIAVLLHDPQHLESILTELSALYPQGKFESWKELAPELGLMVDSFDQYMIIFIIIILLALSFGIVNTMLMAVLERVREIGMLMAIGMNRWRIFSMIALETLYLVLIASPLGLLLAYLTISHLGEAGMDLSALYQEGYAAYGFKSFIYPKLENIYYFRIFVMVAITAILASIYPAVTAVRLNPVNAIRKI
jgi:ABC-type lipoprotein release transport system permease subunit